MLECINLSTEYGGIPVFSLVNFKIAPGQLTAVLGKNGAGKSTLLKCLQQQQPYDGNIYLDGINIRHLTPIQRARRIAFLPQVLPCPDVTVYELTSFGRNPYLGINRKLAHTDLNAIDEALHLTGMSDYRNRILSSLSGGERQRAFWAMVLAQSTEILVLDEPTTYMDMIAEAEFLNIVRELTAQGKTIIVILHNLSLAVKVSDQIIILDDNRCFFSGATIDCLAQRKIEAAFGVRRITAGDSFNPEVIFTA